MPRGILRRVLVSVMVAVGCVFILPVLIAHKLILKLSGKRAL